MGGPVLSAHDVSGGVFRPFYDLKGPAGYAPKGPEDSAQGFNPGNCPINSLP